MKHVVRRLVLAASLVVAAAPSALAGGGAPYVQVWGPHSDGLYAVHTYLCENPASLRVTAWAEGLVDGKRQTVPIKLRRMKEKGVYKFARNWPRQGTWAIRMRVEKGGHTPITIAAMDEHGTVTQFQLVWEGDGEKECVAVLSGDDPC
jgi:hypothetical protein